MKRIYFFLVILLCATIAYAQNVTINGRERQNVEILEFSAISEPATSSTNKTRMYMDSTDGKLKCSQDGDAYTDCVGGVAESSTQIGALTSGKICEGDGSKVQCDITKTGTGNAAMSDSPVFTTKLTSPWVYSSGNSVKLSESSGSSAVLDQSGLHIQTGKGLFLGTTNLSNGSDKIDGDQVADDTIDDDSIDFGIGADQVSGIDIPLDVTNFDTNLSGTDTNVQAALETLDELASGGDMTQAVYDTDTNNVVDTVDSVPASAINWDSYEGTIVAGAIELSLQAGYSSSTKYYEDPANGDNFVMFQAPASLAESSTAYVDDLNKHHATVTILEPAEGDSANIYQWPAATKITNLSCIADGSTSVPYTLYECTNPTTCTIVKSLFTCGTGGVSFTTFDDDSIASGSSLIIGGGAPSGSPDGTFINVDFKVVR